MIVEEIIEMSGENWLITDYNYSHSSMALECFQENFKQIIVNEKKYEVRYGMVLRNNEIGDGTYSVEFKYELKHNSEIISGVTEELIRKKHTGRFENALESFSFGKVYSEFLKKQDVMNEFFTKMFELEEKYQSALLVDLVNVLTRSKLKDTPKEINQDFKVYKKEIYKTNEFRLMKELSNLLKIPKKYGLEEKLLFEETIYKCILKLIKERE